MKDLYFETRFQEDKRRSKTWRYLISIFQKYINESDVVLELGAGYCYFINNIEAKEKFAVDLFPELSTYADKSVITHVQDATKLDFLEDGSIDVIFASNFLEHLNWTQLEYIIGEMIRVIAPKGRVMIMQPNFAYSFRKYFDDYTHRTIFTHNSLVDWFSTKGFRVVDGHKKFLPLSVKSSLGAFSFLIPFYIRSPWKPKAGQMFFVFEHEK